MSAKIPIENLYYLLSYAWGHFREAAEVDISCDSCPDVENLLVKVFANGVDRLARVGFDRQYLPVSEITPKLRGKILIAQSYRKMTHRAGKMECQLDEFSFDTAPNRILSATANTLLRLTSVTKENRAALKIAQARIPRTTRICVCDSSFSRIQLHRNIKSYRLLMSVCQLIHARFIPEEKEGHGRFSDIFRDEITMHKLFEQFVLNFARRHCEKADVGSMSITWDGEWDSDAGKVLPMMLTDVTIAWPNQKTILDCKFYKDALVVRHDRHRLHSSHLYQLSAYLQNKRRDIGWENVSGILLYPAVDHMVDVRMRLLGHGVRVKSIDLDQPWAQIHEDLFHLLERTESPCDE